MQKSEAKCIYFSDWNSFQLQGGFRILSPWLRRTAFLLGSKDPSRRQESPRVQEERGVTVLTGNGEIWSPPSITHTQRTHWRRVRPREQKGEPERKLKAELTLGGKWKAGAEIRYPRSRKQKLQETNRNLQWIHSIGGALGRFTAAELKLRYRLRAKNKTTFSWLFK